jgi:hypothetical protein
MTRLEIIKVSKTTKIDTRKHRRKLIRNERHVGRTCVGLHMLWLRFKIDIMVV